MSAFLDKLKKNSTIKESDVLATSKFFNTKDMITTSIPAINIALSGKLSGGFLSGLTQFCGPSKHFKTSFSLILIKAYLDKYPESVLLFYDTEFGAPLDYFASFGIDLNRVLHVPIKNIEELKIDIIRQFEMIARDDKVIVFVDSIGNSASKKELDDAIEGKSVGDMSRAKAIKGLFRMVTPYLAMKDIPMIVVNHTYQTQEMYSKTVVSGGTGIMYSSDNVFVIGRQQEKEGTDVIGYNFILNIEKSRFAREKSKIGILVTFDGGISKWSGLLDIALESGHVVKPLKGWYSKIDVISGEVIDKKYREADTNNKEFWLPILLDKSFQKFVESKYKLVSENMLSEEE